MNRASATPNYPSCCGTTCTRNAVAQVCTTRCKTGYSFHIGFCHKSYNMVSFVLPSYSTPVGNDPIALLPNTFVHLMVTYNKYCSVPAPQTMPRILDNLLHANYIRSGIGAKKPIITPVCFDSQTVNIFSWGHTSSCVQQS